MVWVPTVRLFVLKLAVVPDTLPVPKGVAPSLNVTVPLGNKPSLMVAVNVTLLPMMADKLELLTVVVVVVLFIVWVMALEVLLLFAASPAYTAVMLWLPTLRVVVENVAVLPDTLPVPKVVAPSLNVTMPVGALPFVIVAVNVTLFPKAVDSALLLTVVALAANTTCEIAVEVLLALAESPE